MAGRIILGIGNPSLDADGVVAASSTLTVYLNLTTTLVSIYDAADLLTPLANPLTCDAAGRFPQIWVPDDLVASVKWVVPGEAPVTYDGISPNPIRNAYYSAVGFSPTGTTAGSERMMGLGATWTLTPRATGRVKVMVTGWSRNTLDDGLAEIKLHYGTGVAPANGAVSAGTLMGPLIRNGGRAAASVGFVFAYYAEVDSLTLGTAYWFDIGVVASLGGTSSVTIATVLIEEF